MNEPVLFEFWSNFLLWLLEHTEKFPKNARFTITQRIENLALDFMECIVDAIHSRKQEKQFSLNQADKKLELLRVMIRLGYERRYLATNSYEYASKQILEAGKMLGGWKKYLQDDKNEKI